MNDHHIVLHHSVFLKLNISVSRACIILNEIFLTQWLCCSIMA